MAAIIIFYIVLVGLAVFLQWKVNLLRKGKIEIQTIHKDRSRKIKVLKQIIRYIGHELKEWLKSGFIKFASWRIRNRARLNYFIETKLPGLNTILTKRPDVEAKHAKNIFWRGVIEYKYKLQRLKAQILEEEEQKIADKEIEKANIKVDTYNAMLSENVETIISPELARPVPESTNIHETHLKIKEVKPKKASLIKKVVKKVRKTI